MAGKMRCKITGCDRDGCGICRRCGDESAANHDWKDVDREKPCFRRRRCERCGHADEKADHDWVPAETSPAMVAMQGPGLRCSRCGLTI